MNPIRYCSWGRYPVVDQAAEKLLWRGDKLPNGLAEGQTFLPFGNGRSYGDVCLNSEGVVLDCRGLNRFISFDQETGILSCEAGVLLSEILEIFVPRGWFLPVTPGTQFVTVGGAIANDVHGKNHHKAGTFGCHVLGFELLRSDGQRLNCSTEENNELFRATIGGLGLTGVISSAQVRLRRIRNAGIDQEVIKFGNVDEFFSLARESDNRFEYTVAWVDCIARGSQLGRGHFIRGNNAESDPTGSLPKPPVQHSLPFEFPFPFVNRVTLRLFNSLYYHKQRAALKRSLVHYQKFFYPLDSIANWNRIYGKKGFFQYQCVVPADSATEAIREILSIIAASGSGSFLAVLKVFGSRTSPGLLSFPMPGATLALDFPNKGAETLRLLNALDEVTRAAGGRVNPSKDARMSAHDFQKGFPECRNFEKFIDRNICSSFWRRVMGEAS